jgi:Carboxypeptidase regulatory-like domain
MKFLGRTFITILFGLSLASTLIAQAGTLSGTVRDDKDHGIAKATITITFKPSSTPFQASIIPSSDGHFEVSGLPLGEYVWEAKAEGYRSQMGWFDLQGDPATLELTLDPLPATPLETILSKPETKSESFVPVPRNFSELSPFSNSTVDSGLRLKSYVVDVLPGFSFTIIAEPTRPFATLSTEALLAQFKELRNAYKMDERKAIYRAESLVSTLIGRGKIDASLVTTLRDFDSEYDTGLSEVNAAGKHEYPNWSTEALRRQLEAELSAHSHYIKTLKLLRATIAELVQRHALGLAEVMDYADFLYRNHLMGSEVDVPLVGNNPPDPTTLSYYKTLQTGVGGLLASSRILVSKSGVALGFVEAQPAEQQMQVKFPGAVTVSRIFRPITTSMADASVVYKIRMWVDWDKLRLPAGMDKQDESPDVQTIGSNGLLAGSMELWDDRY